MWDYYPVEQLRTKAAAMNKTIKDQKRKLARMERLYRGAVKTALLIADQRDDLLRAQKRGNP